MAGFLPAAGRAPLVSVLDAVNFTTFLGFTANPPAGGTLLLQPLLSDADRAHPESQTLSEAAGGRSRPTTGGGV